MPKPRKPIFLIFLIILLVLAFLGSAVYFFYQNQQLKQQLSSSQITPPLTGEPSSDTSTLNIPSSSNFNLIFKYGVGTKNILNTYKNTYTKDLVTKQPITTNFKLTKNELERIKSKLMELGIFDENSVIESSTKNKWFGSTCSSYYLEVELNDTNRNFSWDDCRGPLEGTAKQITDLIRSIVESKEEYKKLPPAQGGYL